MIPGLACAGLAASLVLTPAPNHVISPDRPKPTAHGVGHCRKPNRNGDRRVSSMPDIPTCVQERTASGVLGSLIMFIAQNCLLFEPIV